jgi:WD40 repeat protein
MLLQLKRHPDWSYRLHRVWSKKHGELRQFNGHFDRVRSVAVYQAPSGKTKVADKESQGLLVTSSDDGTIKTWNLSTGEKIREYKSVYDQGSVDFVDFSEQPTASSCAGHVTGTKDPVVVSINGELSYLQSLYIYIDTNVASPSPGNIILCASAYV